MDGKTILTTAPRAAYIHVPFCRHRCGYCNFTVVAGRDDLVDAFLQAVDIELSGLGEPHEVDSIFIGGGTPTHLSPHQFAQLGRSIQRWLPSSADCEFTVEANPSDLSLEKIDALLAAGATRISLGIQSFDDEKLAILERDHRREQALQAIERCRQAFASVSIDLIFATPGESLRVWLKDLDTAIGTGCNHISTYSLTYEKGAAFWARRQRGELTAADEQLDRAMFETAIDTLTSAGFEHYEVSNFARPNHRCRQNEVYWKGHEYFAAGPGAARYVAGSRETNHRSTTAYLQRVLSGRSPVAERETSNPMDTARERLVFQLRMLEGVDRQEFAEQTGFAIDDLVGQQLPQLLELGLLIEEAGRLRLTRDGLMVSDAIWPQFL